MTSKLGASEIAKYVRKQRCVKWAEHCTIYLESVEFDMISKRRLNIETTSYRDFPHIDSHCTDGYGESFGPRPSQIKKVFVAMGYYTTQFADRVMSSLGGRVLGCDATYNVASRVKTSIDGIEYFNPLETIHLIVNEKSQVISYICTSTVTSDERSPQAKELLERYQQFHTEAPVFALDNCCNDKKWLVDGGWDNPMVTGDIFHIQKRIIETVKNGPLLPKFRSDLSKCFGSTTTGVFWNADDIWSKLKR